MILLHHILVKNKHTIIASLLHEVPRDIRRYNRVSRHELRDTLEHLFNSYLDILVAENNTNMERLLKYLSRSRVTQSFSISSLLRLLLLFSHTLRKVLLKECYYLEGDEKKIFNKTIDKIEKATQYAVESICQTYHDLVKEKYEQYNLFLNKKNDAFEADLSKLILFRA